MTNGQGGVKGRDTVDQDLSPTLIHVHDLPQLYQKPTASSLLETLALLRVSPNVFSKAATTRNATQQVSEQGIPRYLTSIISSPLSWIPSEDDREAIQAAAAARLAQRAGRTALPSLVRVFAVTDDLDITIYEPSMTEDNIGFKTWTSSLLLAKRLPLLADLLPIVTEGRRAVSVRVRVLELGSGTGLVGIAAACLWQASVTLTDLPEILGNLNQNVKQNEAMIARAGGAASASALDWSDESQCPQDETEKYSIIVAADPLYSPSHPKMLSETVGRWLSMTDDARFIVELPLRGGYEQERDELKKRLELEGLQLEAEGEESGYDDWQGSDGELTEVRCSWSVWRPLRRL